MNIKLKTWQIIALFLPAVIGCILLATAQSGFAATDESFAIPNVLFLLSALLIIAYQSFLVVKFIADSGVESEPIKWNAYAAAALVLLLLLRFVRSTFFFHTTHYHALGSAGSAKPGNEVKGYLIIAGLAYVFITFFFVNAPFVSKKIRKIKDTARQKQLRTNFLIPLQSLVKNSIVIIAVLGILTAVAFFANL